LWCRLKDNEGRWLRKRTRYHVGEERSAQRYADAAQATVDARRAPGPIGPVTVASYSKQWLTGRRELYEATRARYEANGTSKVQHRDYATDAGRVRKHVLPHLGAMKLADVRPRHLADWVHKLRTTTTLSPHTVRNVYGLVSAMFRDAAVAGHVDQNPAILTKTQLGDDEGSVEGAGRYTRAQFELMIGSETLPEPARVFAALGGLAGLRLGAIAGLRWSLLEDPSAVGV
ncbi:MAG: hypothetical protein IPL61_21955, partial [Myxococcales bacterium]|nr:hypothetical protein [Myxococcales bacterium]